MVGRQTWSNQRLNRSTIITDAIAALDSANGSTQSEIVNYIARDCHVPKAKSRRHVRLALKKCLASDHIAMTNGRYRNLAQHERAAVKRRRLRRAPYAVIESSSRAQVDMRRDVRRRDPEPTPCGARRGSVHLSSGDAIPMCSCKGAVASGSKVDEAMDDTSDLDGSMDDASDVEDSEADASDMDDADEDASEEEEDSEDEDEDDGSEEDDGDSSEYEDDWTDEDEVAPSEVDVDATSDIEEVATPDVEEVVLSDVEEVVTYDVEEVVTPDVKEVATSDGDKVSPSEVDKDGRSGEDKVASSDVEKGGRSDGDKDSSSGCPDKDDAEDDD